MDHCNLAIFIFELTCCTAAYEVPPQQPSHAADLVRPATIYFDSMAGALSNTESGALSGTMGAASGAVGGNVAQMAKALPVEEPPSCSCAQATQPSATGLSSRLFLRTHCKRATRRARFHNDESSTPCGNVWNLEFHLLKSRMNMHLWHTLLRHHECTCFGLCVFHVKALSSALSVQCMIWR